MEVDSKRIECKWYNRESIQSESNAVIGVDSERIKFQCSPLTEASSKRGNVMLQRKRLVNQFGVGSPCFESTYKTRFRSKRQKSATVELAWMDVEALKNMIEDEPHFLKEIVDNDLRRKGGSMAGGGGGWLAKRSIESNDGRSGGGLVVRGGEVNGRGVVLGVFKSLLGEIPGDVMGERGGDTIGVDGGTVWFCRRYETKEVALVLELRS
ncbi:hypothetical protein Tco_0567735 [Tanacetum coccineum]